MLDITGKTSGVLTALYPIDVNGYRKWRCKCRCGNIVDVSAGDFNYGKIKSCGKCGYQSEVCRNRLLTWKTKDELRISKIYKGMKKRCYNPNCKSYKNYGARGIVVCDEWLQDRRKFVDWALANGYKDQYSIDRIDKDGPYAPWNCRWVTSKVQANNKTNNVVITVENQSFTIAQWATLLRVKTDTLYALNREGKRDILWYIEKRWRAVPLEEQILRIKDVNIAESS